MDTNKKQNSSEGPSDGGPSPASEDTPMETSDPTNTGNLGGSSTGGTPNPNLDTEGSLQGPSNTPSTSGPEGHKKSSDQQKKTVCGAEKRRRRRAKRQQLLEASQAEASPSGASGLSPLKRAKVGASKVPTSTTTKRSRVQGSTPQDVKQAAKRPKTTASSGRRAEYALVSGDRSLQLVVSREGSSEDFTENHRLEFSDAIGDAIMATPTGSNTPTPRFMSTRLWRGQLLVTAADQASLEWLRRGLPNIRPWEGVNLVATDPDTFRLTWARISLPGLRNPPSQEALQRLERANPGLSCASWRIWRRLETPRELRLIVGMDDKSTRQIKGLECRPFYGAGRAQISFKPTPSTDKLKEATNKPPSASEGDTEGQPGTEEDPSSHSEQPDTDGDGH